MNNWQRLDKDDFLKDIGRRIRDNRKLKGMTEERLAEESGLSIDTIKKVESGKTDLKCWSLFRICDVLDLRLDYAVEGEISVIEAKIQIPTNKKLTYNQQKYLANSFMAQVEIYAQSHIGNDK